MEKISIILFFIGTAVLVFSTWTFLLVRKHIKKSWTHELKGSLADEKYFELKSRQEYIIAVSTIVFALISYIGFSSISDIKNTINEQLATEKLKVDSLSKLANNNFMNLELKGKDYKDSVIIGLKLVNALKERYKQLASKDIIKQDIFIVDDLTIGDFKKVDDFFRLVKFGDLTTISGQKLPVFKTPPSIVVFSSTSANPAIDQVTAQSFRISPFMYTESKVAQNEEQIKFSVWISQKPESSSFSSDFSKEFK